MDWHYAGQFSRSPNTLRRTEEIEQEGCCVHRSRGIKRRVSRARPTVDASRQKAQSLFKRLELRPTADGVEHPVNLQIQQTRSGHALCGGEPLQGGGRITPLRVRRSIADCAEIAFQRPQLAQFLRGLRDLAQRLVGECQTEVPIIRGERCCG
jgi:hypothetical protein